MSSLHMHCMLRSFTLHSDLFWDFTFWRKFQYDVPGVNIKGKGKHQGSHAAQKNLDTAAMIVIRRASALTTVAALAAEFLADCVAVCVSAPRVAPHAGVAPRGGSSMRGLVHTGVAPRGDRHGGCSMRGS